MILDKIVEDKKARLIEHKNEISLTEMKKLSAETEKKSDRSFYDNLKKDGISIIGEFKKASPSLGKIESKINLTERIDEYNSSADAISCLTEEDHFCGNVDYLKQIRSITELPIIRKDFMIDEYQFYEAKVIGADAVLLITAILEDVQMKDFYQLSAELGLDVLVETHDEHEIERAMKIDPQIIGVNNRDLKTFNVDINNSIRIAKLIPENVIYVSESGIKTYDDIKRLKENNVDAVLIGETLMREKDKSKALKTLRGEI